MKEHRIIGALALALIAVCFVGIATAATGGLAGSRPTQYTTGETLAASDIAGYTWSCQFTPTGGTAAACASFTGGSVTGSSPSTTVTFTAPATGGSACFQAVTRTNAGGVSDPSTAVCKTIDPLKPNPPSNVTVTITLALNLTSDSPITVAMAAPVVTKTP